MLHHETKAVIIPGKAGFRIALHAPAQRKLREAARLFIQTRPGICGMYAKTTEFRR